MGAEVMTPVATVGVGREAVASPPPNRVCVVPTGRVHSSRSLSRLSPQDHR